MWKGHWKQQTAAENQHKKEIDHSRTVSVRPYVRTYPPTWPLVCFFFLFFDGKDNRLCVWFRYCCTAENKLKRLGRKNIKEKGKKRPERYSSLWIINREKEGKGGNKRNVQYDVVGLDCVACKVLVPSSSSSSPTELLLLHFYYRECSNNNNDDDDEWRGRGTWRNQLQSDTICVAENWNETNLGEKKKKKEVIA